MARRDIPESSVLLCERCGYVIERIGEGGVCPECALEVVKSMPGYRPGSAFQRNPGLLTWLRTSWHVIRHPLQTYDTVRADPDDRMLLWSHAIVAGLLLGAAWPIIQYELISSEHPALDFMIVGPVAVLLVRLLIAVEQWGTRFFARRKGWRVTRPIARAICAHAAIGWVISGLLALGGWLLGSVLETTLRTSALGPFRPMVILSPHWMPVAGILAGMLIFETLSAVGMRRMRFVNEDRRESTASPE